MKKNPPATVPARVLTLDDIKPAPFNDTIRQITTLAESGLSASMKQFGDLSCLVWNQRTGHQVTGHQRLKLLKRQHGTALVVAVETWPEGKREGRGTVTAPDGVVWMLRIVDWDEEKEQLANLTANNAAIAGHFTHEAGGMVQDLTDSMPDMANDLLLDQIARQLAGGADDDDGPSGKAGGLLSEGGPEAMELQPFESYDYILVVSRTIQDWHWLVDRLGIERVNVSPIPGKKRIGLARAIDAKRLIALIEKAEAKS